MPPRWWHWHPWVTRSARSRWCCVDVWRLPLGPPLCLLGHYCLVITSCLHNERSTRDQVVLGIPQNYPGCLGVPAESPVNMQSNPPNPPQNEVEGEFILKDYSNINSGAHQPKTNTFLTGCSRTLLAFLAGKLLLLGCLDPCTGGCRDCVFAVKVSELLGAKVRGSFRCRGWLSGKTAFGTK